MSLLAAAKRVLCLWFPDWPIQRLTISQPELAAAMFVLSTETKQGELVRYCNRTARSRGVRSGMPISEVRSLARPRDLLQSEPWRAEDDKLALQQIALRCERFSFCIGLEDAEPPECLLLDVTGIAHFFGDEQTLAEQLGQSLAKRRLDGRIAVADTVGIAWAGAHFLAHAGQPAVIASGKRLEVLPIEALRLPEATLHKLHRLGVTTIGQVLALDRASLAKRCGKSLLMRLDQWSGQLPEMITPCRPLPKFQVDQRLEEGITQPAPLEQLWQLLLKRLLGLLTPRRLGVRQLLCLVNMENRQTWETSLRLCEAVADERRLGELLRLKLEKLRLTAPLVRMTLDASEVAPLSAAQQDWLAGRSQDEARQLAKLVDRLSCRLGDQAIGVAQLSPEATPEHAVRLHAANETSAVSFTSHLRCFQALDRPTALFPQPRPIEVIAVTPDGPPVVFFWKQTRSEIVACWGPERIESRWWRQAFVRRDYYWIETSAGERLWIFRRLQDACWFWHGELL
ncbi:Y-family DNA polymerase [Blastopirellula marina]|uniref:UmuC domain-containing protein n=1 Tax=Blastopirellula marina DSM 3645 TaxID=314230 RepID=A3ZPQ4_9BACT|nr:DNA polymerase Y family protein [Blastopirellula marina]EAQ81732.1 hypothetical protein DSM3645_29162 [Blastopirellula marina DSM 3645]